MSCEAIREKLYEYLFDLLDQPQRRAVETHLAACDDCRKALAAAKRETALLNQWTLQDPPPDLTERTLAAAREGSQTGAGPDGPPCTPVEPAWRWLGSRRFWLAAGALAAAVLLAVGLQSLWISTRRAEPQEAFVYGQGALTPGGSAAYRVFVRNGMNGEAVEGARVRTALYAPGGRKVWTAQAVTDPHGLARVRADVPPDLPEGDYRLQVEADSRAGESTIRRSVAVKRSFRVLVTTDKPLYQPGQTIHIRALSLATADLRPVAGRPVVLEVQDAKGNKVFKKRLETSDYGIASADFGLADQVNLGEYTVSATVGDTVSERSVRVKRYALPKFRIDLETDRGYYQPGRTVTGHLRAEYTFGKPVEGGRVRIVASEFIETFRPFATVDGETDADGRFAFTIPLKQQFVGQERKKGDAFVSLEATVRDTAGHEQTKTLDLTVTATPIRIEVVPESGRLVQGVENVVYVVTAYPDGRPARTRLTLGATRQVTETNALGIAKVKIVPQTELLQLTVAAEDTQGRRAVERLALPVGPRHETVLLRPDRAVYTAGETANLTILSADRRARVFLDVVKDRRTVLMKAVDVENGRGTVALDLPPDLFGTLHLHAYRIMRDGHIVSDTRLVQVNRAAGLRVDAHLDKETYRPGEKAVLEFLVRRSSGDPAQAALSLAAVDEAVFALHEMRPGFERVYFALQEEILKPRYEIHARLPVAPEETVAPDRPQDPDREEAAVILFSAADGGGAPEAQRGETFAERQARFRREEEAHYERLLAGAAIAPAGLFLLATAPLLLYGAMKLFRRQPIYGPRWEVHRLQEAAKATIRWWVLGLYLPFGASFLMLFLMRGVTDAPLIFGVAIVVVLLVMPKLGLDVSRFRRAEASRAVPLLRKAMTAVPAAYALAAGAVVALLSAVDAHLLDEETALILFMVIGLVAVAVVGALSIGHHCATYQTSAPRVLWLGLSRPLLAAAPGLLIVGLLIPAVFGALESAHRVRMIRAVGDAERAAEARFAAPLREQPSSQGLQAPVRVRRYFPETLLWRPEVITDPDGRARLEIPLADSITTWRVAASAVSRQGDLGARNLPLRVFQDFFVDVDLPVALTQHDRVTVPVAVYNYLDRPQTVRLEVQPADWFELLGETVRTLRVAAGEVTSVGLPLRAAAPGRHTLTVKAFGSEMGDAVERRVTVRPDGQEVVRTINGRLDGRTVHEVEVPRAAIRGGSDLWVKIYPGAFSQVVEGLDSIFRMPFGCFEQTSSVTYPNVLVLDYMRRTNQIKPEVEMKALEFINLGYQRLLSYEVDGGGFEWFGRAPAHNILTAYGLMEFADMAKVYDIDPAVIDRTRRWLYAQQKGNGSWEPTKGGIPEGAINAFQGATLRTTAYIIWALAETGDEDDRLGRTLNYLIANGKTTEDVYTLALCASALVAAERPQAKAFLQRLDGMKQVDGQLAHFTGGDQGATFSRGKVLDIETTALAAYAMLKAGQHVRTAHMALAWLVEQKDPNGTWYSTQATVHAMRALLLGTGRGGEVEGEMTVTVTANGKTAEQLRITPETSDVFRLVSLRPFVADGHNTVTLEAHGQGNPAYQVVATHYLPWPAEAEAPPEKEMSIDVAYDTTTLNQGDTLTAHVTVRYHRAGAARMTIVDLGIPPGFEVLPDAFDRLKDRGVIQRWTKTGRQVILYFDEIAGGKPVTFDFRLKAKFPVKAKTPPSTVYQYYEPDVRDQAEPVELSIL